MERFNDIKTRNDLADFLKIPRSKLTHILYVVKPESYYETFEIPKKNGGCRKICAPSGDLRILQMKLANALWEYQKQLWEEKRITPNISHGFEKGKSIITNAKIHRNKRFVLNLDLKDFFDSFHFGRVQGYFEKNRDFLLPHDVSVILAQIVCYNGCLPQGAPSSPVITNLICQILDMRILRMAKKYKLNYTRYADDLTFSTNYSKFPDTQESFLQEIHAVITKAGFSINDKKTRLQFRNSRQEVTGLVVNKKINVNRIFMRETRAMAYQLYKNGEFTINGTPGSIKQLEGRFSFINQLDQYNNKLDGAKHDAYNLNGRERQYRAFLFYKYFYANELPLIVTEGKTDVRYLIAALKNLYKKYPNLIEKTDSGEFVFKVNFFRRSKRWKYFFGISLDGADAMKVLYRYFTGKNGCTDYFSYFRKITCCEQKAPVILLYDNEPDKKHPLGVFLNQDAKLQDSDRGTLQRDLYLRLLPDSKLFLLTNPIGEGRTECEIEDLFLPTQLELVLGGKTFSREDKFDKSHCPTRIPSDA